MSGPAIRSRLNRLRQERQAAELGRDLLDNKREAILRALLERSRRLATLTARADLALAGARAALRDACMDVGAEVVDAATLAQPSAASVEWRPGSVVGVPTPRLRARLTPFAPSYGAAGTSARVDEAGAHFAALVPVLVELAEEAEAVRNLRIGLAKAVRRLKALEQVVMPRLERDAREGAAALEEEDRDESVRRRQRRAHAEVTTSRDGSIAPASGTSRGSAPSQ
jgi:V/A-type H+-transporting ATPase subunit D